jgi:spermidine/putrescine-binding protein
MNRLHAVALAGVLTIALAGCGGSSNKQLSYSDFISQANAQCKAGQAAAAKATTPKELAPIVEKAVSKFKKLKPPGQLKPAFDRFVSVSEEQVADVKKGDIKAANALNPDSNKAASEMGARDCISQ